MSVYRAKAYCASMQADLANWNIAQEAFYTTNGAYSPNAALNDPPGFKPSPGVVFNVTFTNTLGYGATITHPLCYDNLGNQITLIYDSTQGGLQ